MFCFKFGKYAILNLIFLFKTHLEGIKWADQSLNLWVCFFNK